MHWLTRCRKASIFAAVSGSPARRRSWSCSRPACTRERTPSTVVISENKPCHHFCRWLERTAGLRVARDGELQLRNLDRRVLRLDHGSIQVRLLLDLEHDLGAEFLESKEFMRSNFPKSAENMAYLHRLAALELVVLEAAVFAGEGHQDDLLVEGDPRAHQLRDALECLVQNRNKRSRNDRSAPITRG